MEDGTATEKQLARQGDDLVDTALQITAQAITGDTRYKEAGEFLVAVKGYMTRVRAHHAPMLEKTQRAIDAAREAHRAVREGEATLLQPAKVVEDTIKLAMRKFLDARRARQAKIETARREKETQAVVTARRTGVATPPVPDKPLKPRPVVAGVTARRVWKFEVENWAKVDRAYLKPDLVLIRKTVVAFDNVETAEAAIGGIRVWQEDEIAAGGGR